MANIVVADEVTVRETPTEVDLSVELGGLTLTNPVMPASGCFGPELGAVLDLSALGAVVSKTVFADVRAGNPAHRLTETSHGVLNSVGIPSPGSDGFRAGLLRQYQASGTRVVVSVGGLAVDEYHRIVEDLAEEEIDLLEVNVSCPNLEHDGLPIGTSAERTASLLREIRQRTDIPLLVKMVPTVTDIGEIAQAAEEAGAAGLVVANSFPGLAVDIARRESVLGAGAGGYTGPGIKPIALKLVRDAAGAVDIPVLGCGGIGTARDVVEFMLAGATAVQVGSATFTRPDTMATIIAELPAVCRALGVERVADLVGTLDAHVNPQPAAPAPADQAPEGAR